MYSPKRNCNNASDERIEQFPMRALPDREQALLDSTVIIKDLSLDNDLGYFVTKCTHGNTCVNNIHGLHYQTKA